MKPEQVQAFEDRDWWRKAGCVVGLDLRGWTYRIHAEFSDVTTGAIVQLPGSVAERLVAIADKTP